MTTKLFSTLDERRTFGIRFHDGEDVRTGLLRLVRVQSLRASRLTGLGHLRCVKLQEFDATTSNFRVVLIDNVTTIIRMLGEVASQSGTATITMHLIVCDAAGVRTSGYLLEAKAVNDVDVIIIES